MVINYQKAIKILAIIGLISLGVAISIPSWTFLIITVIFWLIALYCYWRYRKE